MSKEYLIEYADRAQVSYDRLPPATQERVEQVIDRLQHVEFRAPYARKISGSPGMYIGRATRDLRIIFYKSDDVITVLDIVRHDKLQGLTRF